MEKVLEALNGLEIWGVSNFGIVDSEGVVKVARLNRICSSEIRSICNADYDDDDEDYPDEDYPDYNEGYDDDDY